MRGEEARPAKQGHQKEGRAACQGAPKRNTCCRAHSPLPAWPPAPTRVPVPNDGDALRGLVHVAPLVQHLSVRQQPCSRGRRRHEPLQSSPALPGSLAPYCMPWGQSFALQAQRRACSQDVLARRAPRAPVSGAPSRAAAVQKPLMKVKSNPARSTRRAEIPSYAAGPCVTADGGAA